MGFLMRCDIIFMTDGYSNGLFQSLLGFLMRCDLSGCIGKDAVTTRFQSLLGFLMRCDMVYILLDSLDLQVSIPVGFSDALRHTWCSTTCVDPKKFQSLLGFLMRCDVLRSSLLVSSVMFQSLLGFLMRCDMMENGNYVLHIFSVNPCWVF